MWSISRANWSISSIEGSSETFLPVFDAVDAELEAAVAEGRAELGPLAVAFEAKELRAVLSVAAVAEGDQAGGKLHAKEQVSSTSLKRGSSLGW